MTADEKCIWRAESRGDEQPQAFGMLALSLLLLCRFGLLLRFALFFRFTTMSLGLATARHIASYSNNWSIMFLAEREHAKSSTYIGPRN